MKLQTPVDSGRLRASMSYTTDGKVVDPLGAKNSNDKLMAISNDKNVIIGTNVVYGPHVEYMSQNGSKGFMLRAYKSLRPIATIIMQTFFKKDGF